MAADKFSDLLASGVAPSDITAFIDNDNVNFYGSSDEPLLSIHPEELLEQALSHFGFTVRPV